MVSKNENVFRDKRPRVLLVEDEFAVRILARLVLEEAGLEVDEAAHGTTALRMLERVERRYDAILLDLGMPGVSGEELAWQAAALRPTAAVVVCSWGSPPPALCHAAWLKKPYLPRELLDVVVAAVDAVAPTWAGRRVSF